MISLIDNCTPMEEYQYMRRSYLWPRVIASLLEAKKVRTVLMSFRSWVMSVGSIEKAYMNIKQGNIPQTLQDELGVLQMSLSYMEGEDSYELLLGDDDLHEAENYAASCLVSRLEALI